MTRGYEWLTPLSANFMPVSSSFTLMAHSSPAPQSGPEAALRSFSSLVSSLFFPFSSVAPTAAGQAAPSPFSLSLTPSYPTGMVQYDNKLECLIHRSHLVDDEKGLEEGVHDPSRGRYLLRLRYKEAAQAESLGQHLASEERERSERNTGPWEAGEGEKERSYIRPESGASVGRLMIVSGVEQHKDLHPR